MYNQSDVLLFILSVKREMTWAEFKKVYDYLYTVQILPNEVGETSIHFSRNQTARALDLLGHCDFEFSKDLQRVYAAPPTLARLPRAGIPQAILAGARFPYTVQRMVEACKASNKRLTLVVNDQPSGCGLEPVRVIVQAEYAKDIVNLGCLMGIEFENEPPAWSILNFSASLDDYRGTLQWSRRRELNWRHKDFNFDSLSYTGKIQQETGTRLSRYTDPVKNIPFHLLWKDDQCAEVDGDWGRYLALKEAGLNVICYDSQRFLFAVPRTTPLPRLVARALTFCSGYLPRHVLNSTILRSNNLGLAVYQDVPPQLAQLAATKIGQELATCVLGV
jgi:hypothetical protein